MTRTYQSILDEREEPQFGRALTLQQAAAGAKMGFDQCTDCRGSGIAKIMLLGRVDPKYVKAMSEIDPRGEIPVQMDKCDRCKGAGGWLRP